MFCVGAGPQGPEEVKLGDRWAASGLVVGMNDGLDWIFSIWR